MHERIPTVIHLSIHLENGQRVYFTDANVLKRALNPPGTTPTAFFTLYQEDAFARTLLYSEGPSYYTWNEAKIVFIRRRRGKPAFSEKIEFVDFIQCILIIMNVSIFTCCWLMCLVLDLSMSLKLLTASHMPLSTVRVKL
ncbi:uncharacterized protein TNCT_108501 [Trichonephila clavata]|uniref:Uncharacterized protein n=1 Tax=Trichonephila clavata TaxID=2740835 RepID=A0A8X6HVH5_TRICU|nr:uncharacterized protein TNCT_108501 [Trichonephila clavata]